MHNVFTEGESVKSMRALKKTSVAGLETTREELCRLRLEELFRPYIMRIY